jgi:hypothetical protein
MENETVSNTEKWMYKNPKTTMIIVVVLLLGAGFVTGVGYTVNLYNSDYQARVDMIRSVSDVGRPVQIDGIQYLITTVKNSTFDNNSVILTNTP